MSILNDIINVSIKRNTSYPSAIGFGTPIFLSADPELNPKAGREWGADMVREYSSLTSVETDFGTTTNVHAAASAAFAQNPTVETFKVGRLRTSLVAQTVTFTVTANPIAGATVGLSVNGPSGFVGVTVADAGGGVGDEDAVATALAALLDTAGAAVGFGATSALNVVTITADTAGDRFRFGTPTGGTLADTTTITAANIETDIANIIAQDDDFYLVLLDATSKSEQEAVADYIEGLSTTNPKYFIARTFDYTAKNTAAGSDTTASIAGILSTSANQRSSVLFTESGEYVDCAWAGRCLSQPAGAVNWAWKTLGGVTADSKLSDTDLGRLEDKYASVYVALGQGISATLYGNNAAGNWIDEQRGSDWLSARIRERVIALLNNSERVPFTDAGIQSIRAEILGQCQQGVSRGFLSGDPLPTCEVPLASEVSAQDKAERHLKGVVFRAVLAGGINKTTLVGELDL